MPIIWFLWKKKLRLSSRPGAKLRCQGPLGPARAQLSWWYIILSSPTFHKDVNRLLKYVQCSYKNHQREDKCTNWISKLPLWLLNTTTQMSRAVYEKSVNFVSANLSRVKDNQESFISREPLGIPHRGPVDQRSLEISKDFPRQGCH